MNENNNLLNTQVNITVTNATMARIYAYGVALIVTFFILKKLAGK